ncbi:MAG: flagellar filament capping protein FliD [Treponema sp.]|nr:flagellar filament capping protein FliD [Treponema sp.]
MAGIGIPGVSDKYKTNDLVEGLMKVERIPLTREQDTLESYKTQQSAWRDVNQKMSSLRDSVKSLYSYDNPFNNKLASSSDEYAITADAGRDAAYDTFKVDVITPATCDRLLSKEIEKGEEVPEGTYTFKAGDKTISYKWRGGKIEDFITSLNKRGANTIKASLIGVNKGKKALLIESLKTGEDKRLAFEDAALDYAIDKEIIRKTASSIKTFGTRAAELSAPDGDEKSAAEQKGLPALSTDKARADSGGIKFSPRGGAVIKVPAAMKGNANLRVELAIQARQVSDITMELNESAGRPEIPGAGSVTFGGITIENKPSETGITNFAAPKEPLEEVRDNSVLYALSSSGEESEIEIPKEAWNFDAGTGAGPEVKVSVDAKKVPGLSALVIRNRNTGVELDVKALTAFDSKKDSGYEAVHPISEAGDAVIKYEGITITRPENDIDDVVPGVTLHLSDKTERTATISIKPDTESAKDALIQFVGKYNQTVAEINILSQNKPEIIEELDYLTRDEKDGYQKKLGLFFNDFSLSSAKGSMQRIISAQYKFSDSAEVTMLNLIGISTNATNYSGYNPGKMRGYLEIDEKKLDEHLKNNLEDIKKIFGYDSDGDLIVDSGIGYLIDKQLTSYVQTGGILANKDSVLNRQIDSSQKKITKLESQLDDKEAELRSKYGQMEGTLNSLEKQQEGISNFTKQNQKNN